MSKVDSNILEVTPRTRIRHFPQQGKYDTDTIYGILDKTPIGHVAFNKDGLPAMLPMVFWRVDDVIYFHGAEKNRMFGALEERPQICFTATILDGFVAARDALHHSVNYRCVVAYGEVEQVTDPAEKLQGMKDLMDRFYPNRWEKIRPPSRSEFDRLSMYKFELAEASAKINASPGPYPDFKDQRVWAGIIPVEMRMGEPFLDPEMDPETTPPQDFSNIEYVTGRRVSEAADGGAATALAKPKLESDAEARARGPAQIFYQAQLGGQIDAVFELADGSARKVKARVGESVMEAAKAADIPGIIGECCGSMVCATCHVTVANEWLDRIPGPGGGESMMLEYVEGGREPGSRLSCQVLVTDDMDGLTVKVPDEQR